MRPAASAFALCTALLLVAAGASPRAADPVDGLDKLSGTWTRNASLSDDPVDPGNDRRTHPPFVGPGAPMGPMSGAGGGGPLIGRGGYGRNSQADVERTRVLLRFATDVPDEMMISTDGKAVTITTRTGRVQHLTADGKKVDETTDSGFEIERKTKWDDGALVTTFKGKQGGGEGKHVFRRNGDRLTLQVVFEGDAALRTVKVKHVYELKSQP